MSTRGNGSGMKFKKIKDGEYTIEGLGCGAKVTKAKGRHPYGWWTATARQSDGTVLRCHHNTRWMASLMLEKRIEQARESTITP